jgi:hypothetical protein
MLRSRLMSTIVACLILVSFSGCLARQVTRDGQNLRQAVLQLYADQAMDNLICAYENRPFVQVAYDRISVNDTDTAKGTADFEQTLDQTRPLAVAALSKFTRVLKDFWSLSADGSRVRRMTFYANPVTNQDDVYEAYLRFAKDPSCFCASAERPTCALHVMKEFRGMHYWVPEAAAPAYQSLILQTAFMRGPEKIIGYYQRICLRLRKIKVLEGEGNSFWIDFDAPVPNGKATIMAILADGRKYRLVALYDPNFNERTLVSSLQIQLPPKSPLETLLAGGSVRVYSELYPPEVSGIKQIVAGPSLDALGPALERLRQQR